MNTFYNPHYVVAASVSVNYSSPAVFVNQQFGFSVQAAWISTSSLLGSIKIQASNDNVVWSDVANTTTAVSGSGSSLWNLTDVMYQYFRVTYTSTSGTGTVSINIVGKGV